MPEEASPSVFAPYLIAIGDLSYTVLPPEEPTAHRVVEPNGQTIAVPCEDSTATLTAEALAAHLANPPVAPVAVPSEVGSGQLRAAMVRLGWAANDDVINATIEAAIEAAIPAGTTREEARTLWRNASAFKRDHAFLGLVAVAMSKTADDVDALFITAATI